MPLDTLFDACYSTSPQDVHVLSFTMWSPKLSAKGAAARAMGTSQSKRHKMTAIEPEL